MAEDVPAKAAESLKVMLETAVREYNDENDRAKQLDSKTMPMVAATGAVLLFVAGALADPPSILPDFWRGFYFGGVCLTLLVLAAAQGMFLTVLWGRPFQRIVLKHVVDPEWMSLGVDELRKALADRYCGLVSENTTITNRKATYHKWGLTLLSAGIALLVLLLVVSGATIGSSS